MLQVDVTLTDDLVSFLSHFMNSKNNKKTQKIIIEPKDNLAALIEFITTIDKSPKLNPPKSKHQVVLNKNGDWVTL